MYSNYYESGLLLFAKYLDQKNVKYTIYEPSQSKEEQKQILQDFKNKEISLLLLHPSYYEGFSISGVQVFHILDPIDEYYVKEQLFTRVIRYKSHYHLPEDKRNVIIIQWYCTMENIVDKVRQGLKMLKSDSTINFDLLENIGGPDDLLIQKVNTNETFLKVAPKQYIIFKNVRNV